jgi:dihydroxyacid dehydratase/phosphogluconate dehydratase
MSNDPATPRGLARRSANYGDRDFALYLRRSFAKSMGYSQAMLDRPVVGIVDTGSDFNNCHRTTPELIAAIKRGVLAAGGLPLAFPTVSLCEPSLFPTSMHYRNLAALDTEAMLSAQPMDAAVLVGGCDKTVPAQLMAAASADIPCVQLVTGPMLATPYQGERLAACTDCRRYWAAYRAGRVSGARIAEIEGRLATTAGTCGVMGTASTMACIAEALGFMPAGHASIPAVHAERLRAAEEAGTLAMRMIDHPVLPSALITDASVENALRVLLALGGSTNALIHLTAIAGRRGVKIDLDRLNALSDDTPVLVDLKPTGEGYMEDFHAAGGMPALLWELRDSLHKDVPDITGRTLGERLAEPAFVDRRYIRARAEPVSPVGGLVALFGSLAPRARDPQAQRRDARAVRARSPRRGVRRPGRPGRAHRRSGAGRHPGRCAGAEERRPADPGRHAGSRLPADPVQAGARRGEGHAAPERLPDVGYRLRHHRAAYRAGGGGRRPAGAGGDRRHPSPVGGRPADRRAGGRGDVAGAPRRLAQAGAARPRLGPDRGRAGPASR